MRDPNDDAIRSIGAVGVCPCGAVPAEPSCAGDDTPSRTQSLVPAGDRLEPYLPYRLETGINASWCVAADDTSRLAASSRDALIESVTGNYMTAGGRQARLLRLANPPSLARRIT